MVGCCPGFLHSSYVTELFDDLRFKVGSLVGMDPLWQTIMDNEAVEEGFCCCLCSLVAGWNSQGILDEMVGDDKDVLVATFGSF